MTTLSLALVFIFVLYLVDKHNRWRQAVKVVIGLAVLGALVIAALFGWAKYGEWQKNLEAAKQQKAWQASVNACEERNLGGSTNAIDIAMTTSACEKDPTVILQNYSAAPPLHVVESKPIPKPRLPKIMGKIGTDTMVYSDDAPSNPTGRMLQKLSRGDEVQILEKNSIFGTVRVKTSTGVVGWISDSDVTY
jgi:hypothetical protein